MVSRKGPVLFITSSKMKFSGKQQSVSGLCDMEQGWLLCEILVSQSEVRRKKNKKKEKKAREGVEGSLKRKKKLENL